MNLQSYVNFDYSWHEYSQINLIRKKFVVNCRLFIIFIIIFFVIFDT